MFKIIFLLFVTLLFSGCFSEAKPPKTIEANQRAFEKEDEYILFALRAEQLKNYNSASELFNTLWEKSKKKEYLYRALSNDLAARRYEYIIRKVDSTTKGSLDDFKLIRLKIVSLVGISKLEEARVLSLELVEKSKEVNDYILVSEIYIKQAKFDTALKYLESAYVKDYNEKLLDKMSIILYVNLHRKKDAIAQLQTHTRMHGCSKRLCTRLISFYSDMNDIEGLLSVYLKMYELEKNPKISKRIIQIYTYKKDFIKLMSFLQETQSDNDLLLNLYIEMKNYKKAFKLADKLYVESGDINYLGQSAIFEYESSKDKSDKKMQQRVVNKLTEVAKVDNNPLYLNYLGYLLIDHSIDIKKGIVYVKKALKIKSDSAFYLDSLAWGYYKLGRCKEALDIILKVREMEGGDDPEVLKHVKIIKECKTKQLKDKKRK